MKVYTAINQVQEELSKMGIAKDRRGEGINYKFRGIDDIYNVLAGLLAKYKLCILPRVLTRNCQERTTRNGAMLYFTTLDVEYDFVSADDGSKHTIRVSGEAMDTSDKSTNKAMSAAYKYACLQTFCIPTEADNDIENESHEVMPTVNVDTLVAEINNAKTLDELKKTYLVALKQASANSHAKKRLEEAKDKMKIILSDKAGV